MKKNKIQCWRKRHIEPEKENRTALTFNIYLRFKTFVIRSHVLLERYQKMIKQSEVTISIGMLIRLYTNEARKAFCCGTVKL
jgi:hypothetical protein